MTAPLINPPYQTEKAMKHTKKILTSSLMLLCTAGSAMATANPPSNWYAGVSGDVTWMQHTNTGGGGNVELGYQLPHVRVEAEGGYHTAGGDGGYGDTHYYTYMGNLYWDIGSVSGSYSGWQVTPYIGGGLGDAQIHRGASGISGTSSENSFAYQGMAGLTFASASMPNTDWSLGYRYLGADDTNPRASNVELAARFRF